MSVNAAELEWNVKAWDTDSWQSGGNFDYLDLDNDGILNLRDEDKDGDGVINAEDNFAINIAASTDTDSDGKPDSFNEGCDEACIADSGLVLDLDDDNDGVADVDDDFPLDASKGKVIIRSGLNIPLLKAIIDAKSAAQ
jgi:hypothetical protein